MNISVEKFDCFNVYHENDATQFFHVEINNNSFYKNLFDYFFSEDNLLQYAENISSITFFPSKKNFVTLFKQLKVFIDQKNQEISIEKLDNYLRTLLIDDGKLIDKDGKVGILLDKIGKIGEYIFCCLLSDYFKFDCIIPKVHLQTDYNMSVYGIDTLYYSQQNDLLLFGESKVSKSVSNGMSYQDYVGTLLLIKGVEIMSYRAMDIQEATVQSKDGYSDFRMDNVISSMDIAFNYEFVPVFYGNYKYGLEELEVYMK